MTSRKTREDGREAGIDPNLLEFLLEHFSLPGHHHTAGQIDDLEEAVNEIVEGEDGDDEEEEHHHAPHFGDYEDEH